MVLPSEPMFSRRPGGRCHASALHRFETGRIVVSVGRFSNVLAGHLLSCEDEAQRWLGWTEEQRQVTLPSSLEQADLSCLIATASYSSMYFAGVEAVSGRVIGYVTVQWNGEAHEIGGAMLR